MCERGIEVLLMKYEQTSLYREDQTITEKSGKRNDVFFSKGPAPPEIDRYSSPRAANPGSARQ